MRSLITGLSWSLLDSLPSILMPRRTETHLVLLKVQHSQERIRIRLIPIYFNSRAKQRLREDQIGQSGHVEDLGVGVEELAEEVLQTVEVDSRLRVEPFEIDVDHVHVLTQCVNFILRISGCCLAGLVYCLEGYWYVCTSSESSPSTRGSVPDISTSLSLSSLRLTIVYVGYVWCGVRGCAGVNWDSVRGGSSGGRPTKVDLPLTAFDYR